VAVQDAAIGTGGGHGAVGVQGNPPPLPGRPLDDQVPAEVDGADLFGFATHPYRGLCAVGGLAGVIVVLSVAGALMPPACRVLCPAVSRVGNIDD
jgi:hypothetical protein